MFAIVVHGGAGRWKKELEHAVLEGVRRAAEIGAKVLSAGGSALDAAVAAVVELEDNPVFNAGTGSALNIDGEAEMDAGVMVGKGLRTGNVAGIKRVRNPVRVAQKVMEETEHVLLAGEGALRFARAMGFPDYDPVTPERLAHYQKKFSDLKREGGRPPYLSQTASGHYAPAKDTVGAVALDVHGGLAAATSTGGIPMKLAGRVGDTPIPGAGNYATVRAAASATGQGELMMRFLTTKTVCDLVAAGLSAPQAVVEVLARMATEVGQNAGCIAVDASGAIGIGHLTPLMPHAYVREGRKEVTAAMWVGEQAGL
jgi:beta-aspartyl-peptidase (threonine type)